MTLISDCIRFKEKNTQWSLRWHPRRASCASLENFLRRFLVKGDDLIVMLVNKDGERVWNQGVFFFFFPYLPLQVKINPTYRTPLFFFCSPRPRIRNLAVSICVFISKHNQMPHLPYFEIDWLCISCSSEAQAEASQHPLSPPTLQLCIFSSITHISKRPCLTFISVALLSSRQAEVCPTENN